MIKDTVENAVIENVSLFRTEYGSLMSDITVDYGDGSHQRFGGYTLHCQNTDILPQGMARTGIWISRLLEVLEVKSWSELVGTPVRVRRCDSCISAIGHFLKDQWFDPEKEFSRYEGE